MPIDEQTALEGSLVRLDRRLLGIERGLGVSSPAAAPAGDFGVEPVSVQSKAPTPANVAADVATPIAKVDPPSAAATKSKNYSIDVLQEKQPSFASSLISGALGIAAPVPSRRAQQSIFSCSRLVSNLTQQVMVSTRD
eukprot:SAG31_NODE_4702_length_3022_cov_6.121108_1_plen_138_part_00